MELSWTRCRRLGLGKLSYWVMGRKRLSINFNGHLVQFVAKPGNSSYLCWESPRFPQILTFTYETNPCFVIKFLDLSFLYFHERNRLWSKRRLLVYNLHPFKITEPVFVAPPLKPPCGRFDPPRWNNQSSFMTCDALLYNCKYSRLILCRNHDDVKMTHEAYHFKLKSLTIHSK